MTRRMKVALIGGALLGLVCVIGAYAWGHHGCHVQSKSPT